jgi:hypothetical protein
METREETARLEIVEAQIVPVNSTVARSEISKVIARNAWKASGGSATSAAFKIVRNSPDRRATCHGLQIWAAIAAAASEAAVAGDDVDRSLLKETSAVLRLPSHFDFR